MVLTIRWGNRAGLTKFARAVDALGDKRFAIAGNRAVNKTGDKSRTQVRRALTRQTGLKRKVVVRAVQTKRSTWTTLAYTMSARGGDIALKHFKARETRRGVSAAPFGKRKVFAGTFIKGGRFPNRKPLKLGGHAWKRTGSNRTPIEKQKSGVIIPAEMVKGPTKAAFDRSAADLDSRMAHELRILTNGIIG